jgi:hypothetical protein
MKPETSETVTKVASAAATALATHTNPYGFIPLLLPLAVAAGVSGLVVLSKSEKPSTLGSLFSIPTFLGAGAGYAVGAATKVDDKTRIAYSVIGMGAGWAVQRYLIAPNEMAAEAAAAAAAVAKPAFSWLSPSTWF